MRIRWPTRFAIYRFKTPRTGPRKLAATLQEVSVGSSSLDSNFNTRITSGLIRTTSRCPTRQVLQRTPPANWPNEILESPDTITPHPAQWSHVGKCPSRRKVVNSNRTIVGRTSASAFNSANVKIAASNNSGCGSAISVSSLSSSAT